MKIIDLCSVMGQNSGKVCNVENLILNFVTFSCVYLVFVYSCHKNKLTHQAPLLNT
jgi:hypothetical protein